MHHLTALDGSYDVGLYRIRYSGSNLDHFASQKMVTLLNLQITYLGLLTFTSH